MDKSAVAVVAALLACSAATHAQDGDRPKLSFDGFATIGAVHSDEGQADFASGAFAPEGAGHSNDWSFKVDSRVGLQLTAEFTDRLSGIVQVVVEQRYDDSYVPTLEWANLTFAITPDLSVRAGRLVLPAFLVSEYRKVGYANPWLRPPQEVYSRVPVSNVDGIDLSYRSRFGGFTNTLRGTYGRKDPKLPGAGTLEARNLVMVSNSLEYGATTLFAQYSNVHLTLDSVKPLFDAFRQFGPAGQAIAARYDIDDKRFEVMSVGARHDPGDWFVMGEWARVHSRTLAGDDRGWYVTGGYRFGAFTPYVTVARVRTFSNTSDPGLPLAGLPPPLAAAAGGLNARLNQLLGAAAEQKSVSVGARWDFARNAAFKVQYDHLGLDAGSQGVLINAQPGFRRGGSVSLFSIALDVVF